MKCPIHRKRPTKQIWGLMRGESIKYDETNTNVTNTEVTNTRVTNTGVKIRGSQTLESKQHGSQPGSHKSTIRTIEFIVKGIKCAGFLFSEVLFLRIDALEIPITLIREVTGARYCGSSVHMKRKNQYNVL